MVERATFAVELKDETSGAANDAAAALGKLKSKIDDDVKALREMQRALRNLKGGTSTSSKAFSQLKDRISAQKASIATAQSKFLQLGGTFGKTKAGAQGAAGGMSKLGGAMAGAQGPLGSLGGGLARLGPLLANPITLAVALAAAMVALGAAILVATAALLKFAIAQGDVRRNEALQIEGLNTIRTQWGRATASVQEFQAAIDRASDSTNIGRGTLQTYARQLSRAGLRGDALTEAVEAMGIAAQVQGDRGANRFRALAINARLTGGSVRDLAEQYRNRLGPIARRQMLGITNQTDRFRRSIDRLFSGLKIEGFLGGLDDVLSLFSQSTATGRALKAIIEALFQPMIDASTTLFPVVKRFFQGMVIAALLTAIVFLTLRNALRDVFEGSDFFENVDLMQVALFVGIGTFGALVAVVFTLALAFGILAAAVFFLALPFLIIVAAVIGIGIAVVKLGQFLGSLNFAKIGRDLIDGLAQGIRDGLSLVTSAVRSVADSAVATFRSVLGISSPSRLFANFGANISGGVAEGVGAGATDVNDAVGGLVDEPTGGGIAGTTSISIGDVNIDAGETNDPRELALAFRDELARALEGVSVELGAT